MRPRQAVLLVGGRGTRMWPLTETMPKALLPVGGLPFVEFQLRQLDAAGVEQVFLAVGRDHEPAWERYVSEREGAPEVCLSFEDEPLDTAGPVVAVLDRIDDPFFVLNGDIILDTDLAAFASQASPDAIGTLALIELDDPSAYGVVVTGDDGRVGRFVEKPPAGAEPANTVNAGMYLLRRDALAGHEPGPLSFERTVFPSLAEHGLLGAGIVVGTWLDIGTPELYLSCNEAVFGGMTRVYRPRSRHVAVEGASVSGRTEGAWSWIGAGALVADGAVVAESVVLPGARIAAGARVHRAVVGWNAEIGEEAVVCGATLVGAGASVGAGCELDHVMRVAPGAVLPAGSVTFSPPR
jgi:mannose-1-phosphate guanylyltransferase